MEWSGTTGFSVACVKFDRRRWQGEWKPVKDGGKAAAPILT